MGPLGPTTRSRPPLRQRPRAPRLAEPASRQPRARNRWLGRAGRFPPGPTEGARIFMAKCASPNASRRVGAGRDGSRGCRRRSRALARADWPSAPPTILTMRCASLRRDGHPCYATATWARLHCPAHDPAMRRRPASHGACATARSSCTRRSAQRRPHGGLAYGRARSARGRRGRVSARRTSPTSGGAT